MKIKRSPLLVKEDYWAIWIGGLFILVGIFLIFSGTNIRKIQFEHRRAETIMENELEQTPFKTVAWHQAAMIQQDLTASGSPSGKFLSYITGKPHTWSDNPIRAFWAPANLPPAQLEKLQNEYQLALNAEAESFAEATSAEDKARQAGFENETANQQAKEEIKEWLLARTALAKIRSKLANPGYNVFLSLILLTLVFGSVFGIAMRYLGLSFRKFVKGFVVVFLLAIIAYFLASYQFMKTIGFGYAAWAIILGLLISNTVGVPGFIRSAAQTELFIKTGLVLLGAEILLGKILAIGLPGIFVSWIVTPIVLITTYWFGQKVLKIGSKTLNITISADMSVCGVSAAVATAAACNAKKEELTLAIGLSMIFTSIMMIVLPLFINWIGMPEVLGGAWIGGTIDATGAVVAAGAFLGDTALSVAATIKMIQNILIGLIAFGVAVYFTTRVDRQQDRKVGWNEVWLRFPKFILGFLGASVLFTIIYALLGDNLGYSLIDEGVIDVWTSNLRSWLFCLAFVSIGLSVNFKELQVYFKGGKPLILYLTGQAFNILFTLLMAYLMFYVVFPEITSSL